MNPYHSICVLRLSALGDCINAFGLVNALQQHDTNLDISYLIDKRFASLFIKDNGDSIVPLIPVDIKKQGLIKALWNLRKEQKEIKFDALLNLQTSIKASLLSTAIHAKDKFGYDKERRREGKRLFINKIVKSPDNPHVLAGFMAYAKAIGIDNLEPCWDYDLSDDEMATASALLPDGKIFCIAPASAKKVKNWTVEGYSAIAQYAINKGFKVVLLGSNSSVEQYLCSEIVKSIDGNCTNLCGKTNLRTLAAVIKLSKLVLSPDSAAMHLASSLNIPVIGLFAIHNPKRVGAWNFKDLEVSVYEKMAKQELGDKEITWRYRVKNENAMKEITVESVISMFDKAVTKYKI